MIIETKAKINLSLDVLKKLDNGYHSVEMILQQIDLSDTLSLEIIPNDIIITSNSTKIPCDERNIVYKAAQLFFKLSNINRGIKIHIEKRIPICAGLAGGSTNAAGTLKGLNSLFKTGYSIDELMKIGSKLGADVPFCIIGKTMLAEGIGEKLSEISGMEVMPILLVKPNIGVSTRWVYENLDLKNINHIDTKKIIKSINDGKVDFSILGNVLEAVTAKKYPIIENIKTHMLEKGAVFSMMSGSGPTVFGIFEDEETIKTAFKYFKNKFHEVFLTYTTV